MTKGFWYVSIFSVIWALEIIWSRYVLNQGMNPLNFNAQDFFFGLIFILLYTLWVSPNAFSKGSRQGRLGAAIAGIVGGGIGNVFAIIGLSLSTATNYGFLIKIATAFTIILAYLWIKEPISRLKALLFLTMLAGAYLLSTGGRALVPHVGDIFILLGALGYAVGTVLNRKVIKKDMDPLAVAAYRAGFGFAVALTTAALFQTVTIKLSYVPFFIVSGLLMAGTMILLTKSLKLVSASYLGMISMSVPVMVAVLGAFFFQDRLNPIQWFGGGMIVVGGILTQVKRVAHHE